MHSDATFHRGTNSVVLHEVPLYETELVFQHLWLELTSKF